MIAIAISSVITGGITMTIFQVIIGSARTNNHMIAVRQAQNAGYWVSHDAQMAQSIRIGDDPATPGVTEFLTLTWTDWDDKVNQAVYSLENMSGGTLKQLKRTFSKTGETTKIGIIAQFVDPATKCGFSGGGTFTLPDSGDAFTISSGTGADSGKITVAAGSILVTPTGTAGYNSGTGAWTTPAAPATGTVTVSASGGSAAGTWTSITASATATITSDSDGNVTITGVLTFTVTATVQNQSETRVYEIVPRPG